MPARFLSEAQRDQLSGFPRELDAGLLERFFTLSDADVAEASRRRGDQSRLGWALQLCGLRMLGLCPDGVTTAPRARWLSWPASSVPTEVRSRDLRGTPPDPHGARQPGEAVPGVRVTWCR